MAKGHRGRETFPCPDQRHHGLYRPGYGGGSAKISEAVVRDRRATDVRNERGRRSVRFRQDVLATSGEECPRHEEGGGLPHAVYGSGETAPWRLSIAEKDIACHSQGRCPRHWEEHRWRCSRLQQLRRDRPGCHGAL